ncbi:arylamine N-acetyltransferase family protein [Chitinophagaceae bacterium MMS25-I14]
MDFNRYLERIGIERTVALNTDLQTLFRLQRAHLFYVPFEDIDIHTGIPIELNAEMFYDKVVNRNRGGYCYELNGLFAMLLQHLGFEVYYLSGRVGNGQKIGAEFDHLALLVNTEGTLWLVDVGFGDFSLQPLQINDEVQYDGHKHYRIGKTQIDGNTYLTGEKWNPAKKQFVGDYAFTLTPRTMNDFEAMNHYQQTDPKSHFVQNFICSLPVDGGRISMINKRLIIKQHDHRREIIVKDAAHRARLLQKYFNIREDEILLARNIRQRL